MDRHTALEALGLPLDTRPDVIRAVIRTRRDRLEAEATFAQASGAADAGRGPDRAWLDAVEAAALGARPGRIDKWWALVGGSGACVLGVMIVVASVGRHARIEPTDPPTAAARGREHASRAAGMRAAAALDPKPAAPERERRPAPMITSRPEGPSTMQAATSHLSLGPKPAEGPAAWFERAVQLAGRTDDRGLRESADLFRRAAERGHAPAMYRYGRALAKRLGVARDSEAAVEWFRKAADRGHALAMNDLGWAYHTGFGVDVDRDEAVRWFRKAATNGNPAAMNNYAVMLESGDGVPTDVRGALAWYRRAADGGNATAMYHLGVAYETGAGVKANLTRAAEWYGHAARAGDADARAWVEGFESGSADEIRK